MGGLPAVPSGSGTAGARAINWAALRMVGGPALIVALWWLAAVLVGGRPIRLPTPLDVAMGWAGDARLYAVNLVPTLASAAKGYAIGGIVGLVLGVLVGVLPRAI